MTVSASEPVLRPGEGAQPLLSVRDLHTTFPIRSPLLRRTVAQVQAVAGVSFDVRPGETLGLVGESGSGKSTIARTIIGLETAASGSVVFDGRELTTLSTSDMQSVRRDVQMIFQDPYSSLNPRRTVEEIVREAWEIHPGVVPRGRWREEVKDLLARVGLNPDHADRYPHQFSGGQRQRIGVARALALRPKLIICDEAVSALDVSIQAQVLNLLQDLQRDLGLTYLFIAHDLSVVRHISTRVAVMYLGRIVELADREEIFDRPTHPYTQALLSSVPVPRPWDAPERTEIILTGDIPSPADPPSGCRFRTRCWKAQEVCAEAEPALEPRAGLHPSACHFAEPLDPSGPGPREQSPGA
ncbi:ATP-binding cassette domain-containing protein [Phytoactinopolyspora alkaliphila]|uniref:ATP-binding cassette domain-containing protein n=1 Tax=Phytoactinopolyspora alkaliphila TaxID=1783498 RepID=A0A6N9YTS8_9ACTN|nr:oligopeptide/dipeptide ABC transporter ATP-binding protein [Phytoactinopolyspora alkaliphila]NED98219.1 ATP-binding cassette domain-containing protein [Phytoactinopolyspora alkaliphila]